MRRSRRSLYGIDTEIDLTEILTPPAGSDDSRYKCRIVYGREIGPVEYARYVARKIGTLRIVETPGIDYSLKYADRSALDALKRGVEDCDEIIISVGGLLTDTTYSNLAFFDGSDWYTPDPPLLAGTKRQSLIESGFLRPIRISIQDLGSFTKVSLINAMLDPGEIEVPVSQIRI